MRDAFCKSDGFAAIYSSAQVLLKVGAIDKVTMRNFDEACLVAPPVFEPEQIKQIREQNHVSQPVWLWPSKWVWKRV
ncbi:MAG TPA: hypothetical protein PLL92_01770 [Alicycliphilus sp.]|nr:hypothetical protein [Alicycliphilus sp.]